LFLNVEKKEEKEIKNLKFIEFPIENDRKYIFRPIQEKLVIKMCSYIQVSKILKLDHNGINECKKSNNEKKTHYYIY
jgi:hypothetical protein